MEEEMVDFSVIKYYKHVPFYNFICLDLQHICGLVVSVPGYRSRSPGLIPGATTFLFRKSSGSGTGSTQPRDDN
jgi:hypothetical protein